MARQPAVGLRLRSASAVAVALLLYAVALLVAGPPDVDAYELHRVDTLQRDERLGMTCVKSYEYALFRFRAGADGSGAGVGLSVRTAGTGAADVAIDAHVTAAQLGDFARIECGDIHVHRAVDPHDPNPNASPFSGFSSACDAPPHAPGDVYAAPFNAIAPGAHHPAPPMPIAAVARGHKLKPKPQPSASAGPKVSRAGYLLPQLYPHNQTALARYIASHDAALHADGTLTFAVLTAFATANFSARYVPRSVLPRCRLYVLPPTEQTLYPFVHLHRTPAHAPATTDSAAAPDAGADAMRRTLHAAATDDTADEDVPTLSRPPAAAYPLRGHLRWHDAAEHDAPDEADATDPVPGRFSDAAAAVAPDPEAEPHRSPASSSAFELTDAVPPPLFVHIPSVHTHCRRAHVPHHSPSGLPAHYRGATGADSGVSFIQTAAYLKMLGAALSGVMDIFTDTVMDIVGKGLEHTMMSEVTRTVNERTPPQVLDLTWPPLRHNITNTVTDAVVHKVVGALAKSMPLALGPYIVETVFDYVVPNAYNSLSKLLTQDISMELIRNMPTEVNRALSWSLTNKLTRSLTHALTATLTVSLSHPTFPAERAPVDEIACTECFYHKKQCELCHSSSQFVYYAIYYSTYYSDYYSDYYAPYYTNAMKSVDETRNPDVHYSGDING